MGSCVQIIIALLLAETGVGLRLCLLLLFKSSLDQLWGGVGAGVAVPSTLDRGVLIDLSVRSTGFSWGCPKGVCALEDLQQHMANGRLSALGHSSVRNKKRF